MKNYLDDQEIPFYLNAKGVKEDKITTTSGSNIKGANNGEADAAAGSVLQRVSSFSLFPTNQNSRPSVMIEEDPGKIPELPPLKILPTWRLKDRMKTVGVGLVMALNVGTDPPDITKPHPCAKLQCWMDPSSISRAKAKEKIGERLEAQYAKWQQQRAAKPLKYRRALDPTVEDVRALCLGLRRQARNERILLHYNGHGVPRPTANGEIWVFDRNHTQYIPLGVTDLRQWMGKPSIVVLDCSSAGILMPFLTAPLESSSNSGAYIANQFMNSAEWVRDTIVLCPTSEKEWLPMHPDYPADIFTSCLTTPIKMALRWFVRRNPQSMGGLNPEAVDEIPGKANDRKTPLGELNWIFTAVTDSIAWNILPKPLFQRLFRQDLLVASMFRNFLLADRILRSLNCSPQSYPPLPPGVCDHPLWQAWDLACETCLCGLMRDNILGNHVLIKVPTESDSNGNENMQIMALHESQSLALAKPKISFGTASSITSPFFSEQLTAFEIWLEFASLKGSTSDHLESPEQLPVVLQVLLSQAHRVRALTLLRQFLDLGPWAVNLALSLGIFPYVMKLLQSPEYKQNLVEIWAKILKFDLSCRVDLVKDGALPHFVDHLRWGLNKSALSSPADATEASEQRAMAAFVLSVTCYEYSQGQAECIRQNLHGTCCTILSSFESSNIDTDSNFTEERISPKFRLWLCLCLGSLVNENSTTQKEAFDYGVHLRLFERLNDTSPDVRASACFAISCLLGQPPSTGARQPILLQSERGVQQSLPVSNVSNIVSHGNPGNQLMLQQPIIIPPPTSTTSASGKMFPGHLQPTFTRIGDTTPWQSQQPPVRIIQNIPVTGLQYSQNIQATASFGNLNSSLLQNRHQNPIQQNISSRENEQLSGKQSMENTNTIFEDHRRLGLDMMLVTSVLNLAEDASSIVRYEVVVMLAKMVEKYLPAFLAASEEMANNERGMNRSKKAESSSGEDMKKMFPFPENLDRKTVEKYRHTWRILRKYQHKDTHPIVSKAANLIVSYVHENILRVKMKSDSLQLFEGKQIETNVSLSIDALSRNSEQNLLTLHSPSLTHSVLSTARNDGTSSPTDTTQANRIPLRRISSEFGVSFGCATGVAGMIDQERSSCSNGDKIEHSIMEYSLPKSQFFSWKKDTFFSSNKSNDYYDSMDSLGLSGALEAYLLRRNNDAEAERLKLARYYAGLAPRKPKVERELVSGNALFEEDHSTINAIEEDLTQKKNSLKLKQSGLLRIDGSDSISLLDFHPYEDIVVVYDGQSEITAWNTNCFSKEFVIRNGNPRGSRFTSSCWINPKSNSLLVAGCDDGSVRIWDCLPFSKEKSDISASLVSSFHAIPNIKPDVKKSGLILDWQQCSGKLIAAGNSDIIRIWDVNSEKCGHEIRTDSDACITTLATPCSDDQYQNERKMPFSMGCNILVGGLSDGSIKVFDTRMRSPVMGTVMERSTSTGEKKQQNLMHYKEHKSWVVSTEFTGYDGCNEIVSGSILGDVRIFDLRSSKSLQTYSVQRSKMTAMSVHKSIPMIAAGSHAQFIKVMTLDGDPIQIIRHAEMNQGRRIGPVSSLKFHSRYPLLAAGGRDNFVHLFRPKNPVRFGG